MPRLRPAGAVPVIAGPTAGGKSSTAIRLAQRLATSRHDGSHPAPEIVSADAFQIYRGLDIGTAKPTPDQRRALPHHLIDIVEPTERFSVQQWLEHAHAAIDDIRARAGVPIVVGGTHLYVKALLFGLFDGPGADPELRAELDAMDPAQRRAELERIDPEAARRIHPNDARRTVRALEVHRLTGRPISAWQEQWHRQPDRTDPPLILFWLDWPTDAINRRINARVRDMVERGLVHEARALHVEARLGPQARQALGYKQLIDHFEGRCALDDALERIKIETRRFAKNQRTWLKRLGSTPGAVRLDAGSGGPDQWVQTMSDALAAHSRSE